MTSLRQTHLANFLAREGWQNAHRSDLAGDASNRRYDRLNDVNLGHAVLMDAPPEKGEDTRPFIKIATHLRQAGLSAPKIIANDTEQGFLIIEDLGDDLFARVLNHTTEAEHMLYIAATDALIAAQQYPHPADLKPYDPSAMAETALLATDWYLKFADTHAPNVRDTFHTRFLTLLQEHLAGPATLVQRDYHAENLLWLPNRAGPAKVGLLDFQDAMMGHPAYDLASLLKDARRDVTPEVQDACKMYFMERTKANPEAFETAYATCSAQRNLRIIGVFTRLSVRDGKRHYPDLLPRIWRNLTDDLQHPSLKDFGDWVLDIFPEPTADIIAHLKSANV